MLSEVQRFWNSKITALLSFGINLMATLLGWSAKGKIQSAVMENLQKLKIILETGKVTLQDGRVEMLYYYNRSSIPLLKGQGICHTVLCTYNIQFL
jgi:hypothetical protein